MARQTDVFYVTSIAGTGWLYLGIAALVVPVVANAVVVILFWIHEVRGAPEMHSYNKDNTLAAALVMVLSLANLEGLGVLNSGIFGLAMFKAPISESGRQGGKRGGGVSGARESDATACTASHCN